jgi:CRISPR-associated protein Cas1
VRRLAPFLFGWVADPRTLRLAWDYLAREGGTAAGPNGMRYDDLANHEVWELCRILGKVIRAGTYRPGREKAVPIPKGGGRGFRTLRLRNIADRVVERAMVDTIQPLLDPLFAPFAFGYRPGRDRLRALALAERRVITEDRWVWLTEDLQDAFDHVPHRRLLDLVQKYLGAPDLVRLIETVIGNNAKRGLCPRQTHFKANGIRELWQRY